MQNALTIAILSIGGVFLALTVLILVNKAWRETTHRYRRARRRVIEPIVLDFAHADDRSLAETLDGNVRRSDRAVLEEILLDHIERVRGIERERLGQAIEAMGFVDEYIRRLGSRRWWRRAAAAERLGLAGATRATPALTRALDDEVSEVRMRAAKALGLVGGTASARPLIRALDEPNRWSTIRIADILTSMGRQVVDDLLSAFAECSKPGKLAALDIVGRIRPLRALGWLQERLRDDDADVRARACNALGSIGDPSAGPALIAALDDPEWPVRAQAAKALGRVRYAEAIPALCRALRDPEWWTRANAAESLRRMGTPGLEALQKMLDDADTYARHQAVLMLQESGVVDRQVGMLGRAAGDERAAAESLLRRLVRAGQTGRLVELAEAHPDAHVRRALAGLLSAERDGGGEARA